MRFVLDIPPPVYVDRPSKVEEALKRCGASSLLAVDTETLGKKYKSLEDQVLYMGLSPGEDSRYFVPRKYLRHFKPLLENTKITKALHNFKFDAHRLANAGIQIGGPVADSMIMDWLYDEDTRENRHKLDDCSWDYFEVHMKKYKDVIGKADPRDIKPGHIVWDSFLDYGSLDAWITRKLVVYLSEKLQDIDVWGDGTWSLYDHYWESEEPQVRCLFAMERKGIRIDTEMLESMASSLEEEMDSCAREVNRLAGRPINPRSPKQLGELLFGEMGLKPKKLTGTGAPSCDEESLRYFALTEDVEICKHLLKHRKASKLHGTYAKGLLKHVARDGNIHTNYSPIKLTGRLGSNDPNLQNIPRPGGDQHGIRGAFIAEDGCKLIGADYAQLEMRIMAHASGDENMIKCFREGMDMHSYTASLMMKVPYEEFMELKKVGDERAATMRQAAKAVGFGIIYCIAAPKLAQNLTDALGRHVGEVEAQSYLDSYLESFPGIAQQIKDFKNQAKKKGYVQTITGRFRRLSKVRSKSWGERGHAERQAVNSPIQGTAADIVKKSLIKCWKHPRLIELGCTPRLQVHDELIFNCPVEHCEEAAAIIQECMENPFDPPLDVPLPAEPTIADNWKEVK